VQSLRRITPDKAAEIVRLRALEIPVDEIARKLNVSRSTVYNYLGKFQAFADEAFIEELEKELQVLHRVYSHGKEDSIPISAQAKKLGRILRKYGCIIFEDFIAQAILNANWRRLQACRKPRRST